MLTMLNTPIAWRNSHCVGSFGDSSTISISSLSISEVKNVKNENCEFLQNLCADFVVASSVATAWMFCSFSPKAKKIHRVET